MSHVKELIQLYDKSAIFSRASRKVPFIPPDIRVELWENHRHHERTRAEFYIEIYEQLLKNAGYEGFEPGSRILEVGVGPGLIAGCLNNKGLLVTGLDINDVRLCRSTHLAIFSKTNPIFPIASSSFDYISLTSVLHHIPKELHEVYLQEAARCLKDTGIVMIQEDIRGRNPIEHAIIRSVDWMVSGPEANSHRSRQEWQDFFQENRFRVLAEDELMHGNNFLQLTKQFFVLQKTQSA